MDGLIFQTEKDAPVELVGGKGKGLLNLKSLEAILNEELYKARAIVPPFFIVASDLNLDENFASIQQATDSLKTTRYAVRSSSPLENIGNYAFDGIFDTYLDVPRESLASAILQVRKSASSERAKRYAIDAGVDLQDDMPVIVQAMVKQKWFSGVVYSKFPASRNIIKIIRETNSGNRLIEAFLRERYRGRLVIDSNGPIVTSEEYYTYDKQGVNSLVEIALGVERNMKHPVIIEFCSYQGVNLVWQHNLLQARKLTRLSSAEKYQMPELHEKGLIAVTHDINGTGDFTGEAFVVFKHKEGKIEARGLSDFDRKHSQGYVLVSPYLQFYNSILDEITPNKTSVIAYTDLGHHHDMEISRAKGILYLNTNAQLGQRFYVAGLGEGRAPIETGETLRVMSNGEKGFVFNLTRK